MAFDQKLIDEYARSQAAIKQYNQSGRKDLADNANNYKLKIAQQLSQQGFKVDPNVDLSGDYISKHGENAGKYDTSQKGRVLNSQSDRNKMAIAKAALNLDPNAESSYKAHSFSRSSSKTFNDDLAASLAKSKLEFDPFRQELRVDEASGRKYLPTLTALQFLAGQRQQQYANADNDRSFAYGRQQDALKNDREERAFLVEQQQQEYANRQAEKAANWEAAMDLSKTYGVQVAPKQNWQYLLDQVRGLKPLDVVRDARDYNRGVFESDRDYNRGVFESDRDYNRPKSSGNSSGVQKYLMDIWKLTGVAPEGLPGVEPGTPLYSKDKSPSGNDDAKTWETAISLAQKDAARSEGAMSYEQMMELAQGYYKQISGGSGGAPSDEDIYEYLR